jgi:glutamate-1-semialdehyde 2,1-aminomutase
MKVIAIVQARMGSTRFPGKVLKSIVGMPMIELLLNRLSESKELDEVVLATSNEKNNEKLIALVQSLGYRCTIGSENDVLNRYYESAKSIETDAIVRITGDCPLVDPKLVDKCIIDFKNSNVDYYSNTDPLTFPDGLDVEIISFDSLERANNEALSKFDREHVTPYIRNSKSFSRSSLKCNENLSHERWTVDEPEDLIVVTNIFEHFSPNIFFDWRQVLELRKLHPFLFEENQKIINNEGASMGQGQKLYKRAKRIIPGGNMLLSKRPEMHLPEKWPSYFSKSKGCSVWDMDGKEFIDMSIMGIGTNILGYGNQEVDEAVTKVIKDGNMSTLNCPEEVYLAEKLVELHPWADMVRLARAGGEINSIAVRIARASTGRDKIAICGYHGWHDWYLSSNLSGSNLDGHLLPGLQPNGVPQGLIGTTLTFNYNDIEQLEKLIKENNGEISAIKMEVSRNEKPKDNFLQKVRDLATENKIILIFDECTSGFRETYGGLHKKYDVEPDMAIFAKALGNGYAISACIGKKEYMQAAQQTFISSTFWTERIGPAAALKTLEVMEKEKSWDVISNKGSAISRNWNSLAKKYNLNIYNWGLPALSGFTFNSKNALAYKTLITQEMLKKGYLASNCVYVCTEHKDKHINGYFEALEPIFEIVKNCEEGQDIESFLEGPICHGGFKRLN